jgi:hypothetical protein
MSDEERDQTTLHLRVRWPVIEALDELVVLVGNDALATPGGVPSRAEVARMALAEGIKAMRTKLKRGVK